MGKTRSIDFTNLMLRDALDFAVIVEEEAKDRYEELADQMEIHHNEAAARFFRLMFDVETKHQSQLAEQRKSLFGADPAAVTRDMIFDIEAPEYDDARANMTERQALQVALRAEEKAYEFFGKALEQVQDPKVRELFAHLRDEELEHQRLVQKKIDKLIREQAPSKPDPDDEDEPNAL